VKAANRFGSRARADAKRHVCASSQPRRRIQGVTSIHQEGFERGEKAFHIVDPKLVRSTPSDSRRLHRCGGAEKSGQFELRNWLTPIYGMVTRSGRMLALIQEVLTAAPSKDSR